MRRVFAISVAVLAFTSAGAAQVPGAIRQSPCCGISTANGPTAMNFVDTGSQVGFRGSVSFGHNPHVNVSVGTQRFHHFHGGAVYGYSYPYYYPYYGYMPSLNYDTPAPQPEAESEAAEPPGFTVFERRKEYQLSNAEDRGDRYGEHRFQEKSDRATAYEGNLNPHAQAAAKAAPSEPAEPEESVVTILVYRDGHQRELHNYAIMGGAIYDLSRHPGQGPSKILLADLDLDATARLNQNSGVEFTLPKH